jgi:predicted nucleic-acid-binding Zn-ribbon protein
MSSEERKCTKCGGMMEDGFLYNNDSRDSGFTWQDRVGWMAGGDFQNKEVGMWPLKISVPTNQRRQLTASRCTSCGLVEFYAR